MARPAPAEPGDIQLAFPLADGVRTLVDGPTGSIVYTPRFVPPATAEAWFLALRDNVAWETASRPMYDRVVDVPRLTAHFTHAVPLPRALTAARAAIEAHLGERFDSFGLNWYRDGNDSVAPHHDRTGELDPHAPIALLSLGSTRVMRIAASAPPRRALAIALEPGSLLVMSSAVQSYWTHGIPKVRTPVGPRISIAFRCRLSEESADAEQTPD